MAASPGSSAFGSSSGSRWLGHGAALRAEINVTPLVDVVLVLLVILLVVTPMLKQEAAIDLPIAGASQATDDSRQLTLTIGADGGISLDGEALPRERLGERLGLIFAGRAEGDATLFLSADRSLSYEQVVEVIDACRAAGVTTIGLLTRRPDGGTTAAASPS